MPNEREKLPTRRGAEIFDMQAGAEPGKEISYTVQIGSYADGRPAELFLRSGKAGTDVNVLAMELAVAVSFALQYGCPMETMRDAVPRRSDGAPEGPLGTLLDRFVMERERERQERLQAREAKRAALAAQQESPAPNGP